MKKTSMIIIKIWNKIFSLNVTIKIFFIIMYKVFLLVTLIHCHGKRERQKEVGEEGNCGMVENEDFNLIKMSSFGEISSIHKIKLINRTKPALKCSFLPFPFHHLFSLGVNLKWYFSLSLSSPKAFKWIMWKNEMKQLRRKMWHQGFYLGWV